MNKLLGTVAILAIGALTAIPAIAQDVPMPWAYGFPAPPPPNATAPAANPPVPQDNVVKLKVQGSDLEFTRAQVANRFGPADWFPSDHGPMPEIVAKGREAAARLMLNAARGKHLPEAVLYIERAGDNAPHTKVMLTDVLVTGVDINSEAGSAVPTESVSLSYGTIKFEYVRSTRIISAVENAFSSSFCAVPAFMRVDPAIASGISLP